MNLHEYLFISFWFWSGTYQSAGVIQAAYELNSPLGVHTGGLDKSSPESNSFFSVDNPQVILETIKKVSY